MEKNIIFWCDSNQIHYGLASKIKKLTDFNLFAIFDVPFKQEEFFRGEDIVGFQKKWFLHDHIVKDKKLDIEYLKEFEKKYKINLWLLAYNERVFFKYSNYKKFSENEVLLILEQECKLFEKILDESKPDYLAIITNTHQTQLFYELCKARGIEILLMYPTRFKTRIQIGTNYNQLEIHEDVNDFENRTFEELQGLLKENVLYEESQKFNSAFSKSKLMLVKAATEYLLSRNEIENTHFTYFGRSKRKVLMTTMKEKIQINKRTDYINKNFLNKIKHDDFIFFPLQQEPERTILIDAPYFTNQYEVIKNVAQSLPIGKKLYVKEHISQITRGWRSIEFYQDLKKIPNVELLHPSVKPVELFKKCKMVITITGTAAFECLFYNKPSIVFADTIFSRLSSVEVVKNLNNLPEMITKSLQKNVNLDELNKFISIIEKNSFLFDWNTYTRDVLAKFYLKGNLTDIKIEENLMKEFLRERDDELHDLAGEFIKVIKWRQ